MKKELKAIEKRSLTVEIESELLKRVKAKAKKERLKLRQIVEYFFKEFLK